MDVDNDRVWANIGHVSTYAMAPVPEPGTLSLLALGGLGALLRRRR